MGYYNKLMAKEEIEPGIFELTYSIYSTKEHKFLRCVKYYTSGATRPNRSKEITYRILKNCRNSIKKK